MAGHPYFLSQIATVSATALSASLFGVGCESSQQANRTTARVTSNLADPDWALVDTSPSVASPRSSRQSALKLDFPRAEGFSRPSSNAAAGTGEAEGTTGSLGTQAGRTHITDEDVPFAGPKPLRLGDLGAHGTADSSAGGSPKSFPKSKFQQSQDAQVAKAADRLPPQPTPTLSSERPGAESGPDLESFGAGAGAGASAGGATSTLQATSDGGSGAATRPLSGSNRPAADAKVWGVVLATFSGEGNRPTADAVAAQYRERFPTVPDIHVRSKPSGSVVLAGRFEHADDVAAQELLRAIKSMEADGKKLFPRAMLTVMSGVVDGDFIAPFDVRQLRLRYPEQNPLYSLQVAVWSDLGSGTMTFDDVRRKAEAYCAELRTRGYLAFFSHSEQTTTSVVTVGAFGAEAYDARSTLFSDEVTELLKQFPKHLVNGEELLVGIDPRDPTKMVPQAPRLVEVPR